MKSIIREYFGLSVNEEAQTFIDKKNLYNISRSAVAILIFEIITLVIFILTRKEFNDAAWVSIRSVLNCIFLCSLGALCYRWLIRKETISHRLVEIFNVSYYLMLSLWSVSVAYRNYCNDEQIITFFAVQIIMVCFISLRPALSIVSIMAVYIVLYMIAYSYDGAKGLNVFNFFLLFVVNVTGMMVRFHSEVETAQKSVELEKSNSKLFYNARHDSLTGLRNRKALEEDVAKVVDKKINIYMIDVNYFKEVNDTYGHAVGDVVIEETAIWLKKIFINQRCYRYGGDEFLVLSTDEDVYNEDTFSFFIHDVPDKNVILSIGKASGIPKNRDELFYLISQADIKLYETKRRTHFSKE